MKTGARSLGDSIVLEVRQLKEENAAEYGFNARAIGAAARRHQQEHPERIVSREYSDAEDGAGQPATRPGSKLEGSDKPQPEA